MILEVKNKGYGIGQGEGKDVISYWLHPFLFKYFRHSELDSESQINKIEMLK